MSNCRTEKEILFSRSTFLLKHFQPVSSSRDWSSAPIEWATSAVLGGQSHMALRHLAAVALFTVCLIPLICSHPYTTGSPQWAIQQGGYQYHTQGEIPPHDPYGTVGNLNFYPPPAPEGTEAHLDVIKDVEIGPTQVVIITSKEGNFYCFLHILQ